MREIMQNIKTEMKQLCMQGDKLAKIGDYPRAVEKYNEALTLIPKPRREYAEATWIYTSIGEAFFAHGDYAEAGKSYLSAYTSVGGKQTPQICLRLGQCLEECGDRLKAHEYLRQALDLADEGIFADIDIKYYKIAIARPNQVQKAVGLSAPADTEAAASFTAKVPESADIQTPESEAQKPASQQQRPAAPKAAEAAPVQQKPDGKTGLFGRLFSKRK